MKQVCLPGVCAIYIIWKYKSMYAIWYITEHKFVKKKNFFITDV